MGLLRKGRCRDLRRVLRLLRRSLMLHRQRRVFRRYDETVMEIVNNKKKFVLKALIYLIYLGQLEYTYNMLIYYNYNKQIKPICGKKIKS